MKTYTFIIGSTDDFETCEDLQDYAEEKGYYGELNYSIFEFDCPAECSEEIVTMMGRGYAFSNDWALDGALSFLTHGELEPSTPGNDERPRPSGVRGDIFTDERR
jgi:hypothetical protein